MKITNLYFWIYIIAVFPYTTAAQTSQVQQQREHLLFVNKPQAQNESNDIISLSVEQAIFREMNKQDKQLIKIKTRYRKKQKQQNLNKN